MSSYEFGFAQFIAAFVDTGERVGRAVLVSGHRHLERTLVVGHNGVIVSLHAYHHALQALRRCIGTRDGSYESGLRLGLQKQSAEGKDYNERFSHKRTISLGPQGAWSVEVADDVGCVMR